MAHRWNSRRCVDYPKYRSVTAALDAMRFIFRYGGLPSNVQVTHCPWCHCEHIVSLRREHVGWTHAQVLEHLPAHFEPEAADPSRMAPNLPEVRACRS